MNSETTPKPSEAQNATPQEVRDALDQLQDADYVKLIAIATFFADTRLSGTVVEPEDLLQDAIIKTLEGRRHWKKGVSFIKHLDRTMESDSGHEVEKRAVRGPRLLPEGDDEPIAEQPQVGARLEALDELKGPLALFAEDKIALDLLRLKGNDFSVSEIQEELGIGKTEYDTVTKRIRRRLAKHLAKGGK